MLPLKNDLESSWRQKLTVRIKAKILTVTSRSQDRFYLWLSFLQRIWPSESSPSSYLTCWTNNSFLQEANRRLNVFLVPKETVLLRRWESKTKCVFIHRVDKDWIITPWKIWKAHGSSVSPSSEGRYVCMALQTYIMAWHTCRLHHRTGLSHCWCSWGLERIICGFKSCFDRWRLISRAHIHPLIIHLLQGAQVC